MRKFRLFPVIIFFLLFSSCSKEEKPAVVAVADLLEIEKEQTVTLQSKKIQLWLASGKDSLTILYFYADWCTICQKFRPELLNTISNFKSPLRTGVINSDQEKAAVTEFGVTSLPTLKILKNNKLLYTSVGFLQEKELQTLLTKFAKM